MKTVEGTAWILCDAIEMMSKKHIVPDSSISQDSTSILAQHIAEIFEVIAECEEPTIIEHTADKLLEYAGNHPKELIHYLQKYMKDNPLTEKVLDNSKILH